MVDINAFRRNPNWLRGKGISSFIKHPGNKNQPHYNTLMRVAEQMAGTTGLDDPASGPGGFVQGLMPTGQVRMNEYDAGLVNMLRHLKNTEGGLTIPFSQYDSDMTPAKWREDVRGATLRAIQQGNLPKKGSLNYYLHKIKQGIPLTPIEEYEMAQMYYMNKKTGFQGMVRMPTGYNNIPSGTLTPFKTGEDVNFLDYQPIFENVELRQGDAADALNEWDINLSNLLASDPPYENQPSSYSENYDMQRYLSALNERINEGQPIVAFDSADAASKYADLGLNAQIMIRPDKSGAKAESRGDRLEMVATNIEGFDPLETLARFGHSRFVPNSRQQRDLLDFTLSEPQDAFEHGWAVLKGSQ